MYYTYVLEGKTSDAKRSLYVGSTGNLQNRFSEHKSGKVRTTKELKKIKLVYYEACLDKTDARKREIQLKTGFGRGYIKRRLENYLNKRV